VVTTINCADATKVDSATTAVNNTFFIFKILMINNGRKIVKLGKASAI
jgi:hypothetical protein